MDVSIIIVSYNTCSLLKDCIRSIYTHTKDVEFEVIVVDNASKDDSCEMLSREFPKVQVICSPENLGFGRANNLGIRIAKGKYLFFLNSDTLFLNNALKFFFDYSESSAEKIGALGAILKAPSGENCHSYGRFITMKSELQDLVAKYLRFLKKKEYQYPANIKQAKCVDYITGADLWVPKAVYEKVGGFDPAFFMYCEEVDWQKRMADSGLLRLIIPGPEIIHLEGGSDANGGSRIWSPNRLEMFFASKKIYFRKHFNRIAYIPFRILYVLLRIHIIFVLLFERGGGTQYSSGRCKTGNKGT